MNEVNDLTPEQIVAVAIAHEYVTKGRDEAVNPNLHETLDHVKNSFGEKTRAVCESLGASSTSSTASKSALALLALLVAIAEARSRRNARRNRRFR